MSSVPNLGQAPPVYESMPFDRFIRTLTLYCQQVDADIDFLSRSSVSCRATTGTSVIVGILDGTLLVDTTAGSVSVVLPDPALVLYRTFGVKRTTGGGNSLTISAAAGTIDGGTVSLGSQYGFAACKSDGTNYWIVSRI